MVLCLLQLTASTSLQGFGRKMPPSEAGAQIFVGPFRPLLRVTTVIPQTGQVRSPRIASSLKGHVWGECTVAGMLF